VNDVQILSGMQTRYKTDLEFVVREVRYRKSFHVCCRISQQKDHKASGNVLDNAAILVGGCTCSPYDNVGQGMVEAEVSMCHEVQRYWNLHPPIDFCISCYS
jgi:hypothetical protein